MKFDGNFDFLSNHQKFKSKIKNINKILIFKDGDLSKISDDAKQLIRGMLDTIPEKRLKIDDIVKNSWISVSF